MIHKMAVVWWTLVMTAVIALAIAVLVPVSDEKMTSAAVGCVRLGGWATITMVNRRYAGTVVECKLPRD